MSDPAPGGAPTDAPDPLAALWPLVVRWAVGDDVVRERLIDDASDAELQALTHAVRPLLGAIDQYLDLTGNAERALPFGDLAQAALEADQVIARRVG